MFALGECKMKTKLATIHSKHNSYMISSSNIVADKLPLAEKLLSDNNIAIGIISNKENTYYDNDLISINENGKVKFMFLWQKM
jgi:hypothetical protein